MVYDNTKKGEKVLITKKAVVILLITALLLSATATYITITKVGGLPVTEQAIKGQIGVFVKPVRSANVGVVVLPPEKEEEE